MSIFDRILGETGLSGSERRLVRGVVNGVVRDVRDGATGAEIVEGVGNRGLLEGTRELDPIVRSPARAVIRDQERDRRDEIRDRRREEERQARLEEREAIAGRGRPQRDPDGDSNYARARRDIAGEGEPVNQDGTADHSADGGDGLSNYQRALQDVTGEAQPAVEPVAEPVAETAPPPAPERAPEPMARTIPISLETSADISASVSETTNLEVAAGEDMGALIDRHFAGNNFTQDQRERLVDHIAHLNPAITDVNKLSIGQNIVMPDSPTVPDEVPRQDWAAIHAQYSRQSAPDADAGARMPEPFAADLQGQTFGLRPQRLDI